MPPASTAPRPGRTGRRRDGDLRRVDAVGDLDEVGGHRLRRRAAAQTPGQLRGPSAQQAEVTGADRPARPGEQGEQRGVGGDVVHEVQDRDDLGHLGKPQQPVEADDLDRDARVRQGVEDLGGVRVVARQDSGLGPRHAAVVRVGGAHAGHQRSQLATVRLVDRRADDAVARLGLGLERRDGVVRVVERRRQQVGGLEDPPLRAPVDGERVGPHRPGRGRERLGEVEDVGDRRAAPAVDRLVGVADRGHGVPPTAGRIGAGEDPRQHDRLGHRGVLVLVEQHHPELLPLGRTHVGLERGESRAELDLVGEVHEPQVGLEPPVGLHQPEQLTAPVDRAHRVADRVEVGLAVLARLLLGHGADEPVALGRIELRGPPPR